MISIWIKGKVRLFTFEQWVELLPRIGRNLPILDIYDPADLDADDLINFPRHMTHAEELIQTFGRG